MLAGFFSGERPVPVSGTMKSKYLDRYFMQRLWLDPEHYELILERAFLNHQRQKVTFLGVPEPTGTDGTLLRTGTGQPLFHAEHSVAGAEVVTAGTGAGR